MSYNIYLLISTFIVASESKPNISKVHVQHRLGWVILALVSKVLGHSGSRLSMGFRKVHKIRGYIKIGGQ